MLQTSTCARPTEPLIRSIHTSRYNCSGRSEVLLGADFSAEFLTSRLDLAASEDLSFLAMQKPATRSMADSSEELLEL